MRDRSTRELHDGELTWHPSPPDVLDLARFRCMVNRSDAAVPLPGGRLLLASGPVSAADLAADTAAWLASDHGP